MIISAILCAAGLSTRMGADKLLMEYRGRTLLRHAAALLRELPADERIIVTTEERLRHLELPQNIRTFVNPEPSAGMSASVRIGIQNAAGTHYLFLAADQPGLTAGDVAALIELAETNPGKIVYPLVGGKPCNPVIFPDTYREELAALGGDTGGRVIRDKYPESCLAHTPAMPEHFKDFDFISDIS